MTTSSRDRILGKLRAAQRPFHDAPPRPAAYIPVTVQDDISPDALIERFTAELVALKAEPFVVEGEEAARACVIDLLESHAARHILSWDFAHIPIPGLEAAIRERGVTVTQPDTHDDLRAESLVYAEGAAVGLTGVDAAAATTGTMIFTTGPGKGRIPTVLAPVHIAVVRVGQIVPRIESWIAGLRSEGMGAIRQHANFCFVSGPSRTGDIEMELILGVHGPGRVQVVVMR